MVKRCKADIGKKSEVFIFSPETFLAVESVVWIVIEKSSDAPYYCHPAETESFRKRSESHPPTITGLTPPDTHITAHPNPPQCATTQTFKEETQHGGVSGELI